MPDRIARVWTGTSWEPLIGTVTTPARVAYWQGTAPTGIATGALWGNSSTSSIAMYNGVEWITLTPSNIVTLTGTQTLTNKTFTDAKTTLSTNAQIGTAYTLILSDMNKVTEMNNASANTVTLPDDSTAFPTGATITITQTGAGRTTVTPVSGVTLNCAPQLVANRATVRAQWSSIVLVKRASNPSFWVAYGDLA